MNWSILVFESKILPKEYQKQKHSFSLAAEPYSDHQPERSQQWFQEPFGLALASTDFRPVEGQRAFLPDKLSPGLTKWNCHDLLELKEGWLTKGPAGRGRRLNPIKTGC